MPDRTATEEPATAQDLSARASHVVRILWLLTAVASSALWFIAPVLQWSALTTVCHPSASCQLYQLGTDAVHALDRHGLSLQAYAAFTAAVLILFWVIWYGLAALIVWRKPADRGALASAFFLVVLPLGGTAQWLPPGPIAALGSLFTAVLLIFLLLFPDGRFAPGWTRWLGAAIVANFTIALAPLSGVTAAVETGIVFAFFAAVLGVQIYRYRSLSSPTQRQQTKWAVFGLLVATLGLVSSWLVVAIAPFPTGFGSVYEALTSFTGTGILLTAIPVSIAIAILRSRLWDIDHVINRALVYGALSATLAGIYIASVLLLQLAFHTWMGRSSGLAVALSTLITATLFGPLRRSIQLGIDRRFYRRKYDAACTLATFGERLRDEVDLGRLSEDLTSVVSSTLQPAHVSLWINQRVEG